MDAVDRSGVGLLFKPPTCAYLTSLTHLICLTYLTSIYLCFSGRHGSGGPERSRGGRRSLPHVHILLVLLVLVVLLI